MNGAILRMASQFSSYTDSICHLNMIELVGGVSTVHILESAKWAGES